MYVIGVACIINIALDFLFIGQMGLGPVGAALGTVIAQTASVALALVWLKSRRTHIHLKRSDLRPQPEVLGSILKIGVPVAVQDGCIQVAFMFITVIANHRGLVDAAAVGLVEKMISFCSLCRAPWAPPSARSRRKTPARARATARVRCSRMP